MIKCKGIFGKLLGHRWETTATPVAADHIGPGIFFMHGIGPLKIKQVTVCKRCRAVQKAKTNGDDCRESGMEQTNNGSAE